MLQSGLASPGYACGTLMVNSARSALQGDSTQRWVKDLDVMLGAESAVLILDDTEGVWPRHAANLLQVRPQFANTGMPRSPVLLCTAKPLITTFVSSVRVPFGTLSCLRIRTAHATWICYSPMN